MTAFQVGDALRLKGGGPLMTVGEVKTRESITPEGDSYDLVEYVCYWHMRDGGLISNTFPEYLLKRGAKQRQSFVRKARVSAKKKR